MEGGGGGGGGGGYRNLQNNPPLYRLNPPLTAIDRFLWGQNKGALVSANGFCDFSSSSGAIGSYAGGVSWPSPPETNFDVDELFQENGDQTLNWTHENPNVGLKVEEEKSTGAGKRLKVGSSTLIKGQWTYEEDRILVRLVKQYGERKWAQIAQKLVGRAGKQCRERWHNHLRPEIKKDTWSEEEERMLIEAHQSVGNKWAEIAKRIPGRTENSIKNHWNATKRRQNSRIRKSKKPEAGQNGKAQSSILQDYIRSLNLNDHTNSTTTVSEEYLLPNQLTVSLPELVLSAESTIDDDSPQFMTHTYDDELTFMQNFFGNTCSNNQPSSNDDNRVMMAGATGAKTFYDDHHANNISNGVLCQNNGDDQMVNEMVECDPNMYINTQKEETPPPPPNNTHLHDSDLYQLSNLLDGAISSPYTDYYYDTMMMDLLSTGQATTSSGKEDMDLIEMVSSSQFSQGSN